MQDFLGLRFTFYLEEQGIIEIHLKKSGKPRSFGFIPGLVNILNELSKLDEIDFNGKPFVTENAATRRQNQPKGRIFKK